MKFAHISDVHLGGWKQQPLQDLNFESFKKAVDICINSKLDFVLIAGDLFDSAYPPIEILKETFAQFRRLKEAKIPCFLIAGSHDYSVSGKTFLDVLERSGFCKNVTDFEEREKEIILNPTLFEGTAIYGYPGKKAGLEIEDLRKVKLNDAPGMYKIFMLHTTLDRVVGNLPIDSLDSSKIPKADYYALGHIHLRYNKDHFVYPGPLFPNNFQELQDLKHGSFSIIDTNLGTSEIVELKIKEVLPIKIELDNALIGTEKIISELEKYSLNDKIILLRIEGELQEGKHSDIKFQQIEEYAKEKGAYFLLRNTHNLKVKEVELQEEIDLENTENIEEETIKSYSEKNPSDFNSLIPELMNLLSLEKQEGEKKDIFEKRLLENVKKTLNL